MDNEINTNTQHVSASNLPEDAILYKNCNCHIHTHPPQKIATFNTETKTLTVNLTAI